MSFSAQPVEITMADGVVLRGQRWGEGPDWVILLHDAGEDRDLDDWRPLLPAIMTPERTLLTLDLPGHGASDGDADVTRLEADLDSVLEWAKEQGATWTALSGAGSTATRILKKAGARPIDALVLLTPEITVEEAKVLRGRGEAKLFAVGSRDASATSAVRQARNASIGWAMLVSLPTGQQRTDLLRGPYAGQLIEKIVAFLAEQCHISRTRNLRPSPQR
ncbi:MAG: alpha/beta hydrolase [Thermomicrobiales bacterium]